MLAGDFNVIALMSGTSLDGIDIVYINFFYEKDLSFKIKHAKTYEYSKDWKLILSNLTQKSKSELKIIDQDYTLFLADVILNFIAINSIETIDFISSHGHTALHQPEKCLTYQIGNRQELANKLNHKVICDFRVQDVELGGQGAPLVPIGDLLLFSDYDYCLNLGGFANVSFDIKGKRIAYDICPVNIVLNHYVKRLGFEYDDKGEIASKGKINDVLLRDLNGLAFYKELPPKSLGLEWVQKNMLSKIDVYNLQIKDVLRTFIEHIAIQISKELEKSYTSVLITGGGVYNSFLIKRIKTHTKTSIIIPSAAIIEYKEALIFGLLGVLKHRGEVNCLASVTGASRDHSSGRILIPKIKI
ncbi:anhydro-N-acetylmuramic acid kinase [Winogradskyella immobilis]|uniref:Anhydro-N-acetylmuramic acid kinase n=1 Tax=Winogradskyella immobilis TaxID=2816852 RepID=A0ABS8ENG5_9FLAO|nr:anhydro-N-acetylmuramic acid kinase [Winogradskyella immobilis]MCC1484763.1 anhydro-N-acetylmuramic acid kinase [Winogradskyella immobilis]MCG0016855.1 anhydro-N-acetylmuramic acid kinase [Winogradskyella immobilis]